MKNKSLNFNLKMLFVGIAVYFVPLFTYGQEIFKSDNGKYGFKDKDGGIIVEAKYDAIDKFEEGFAGVRIGDYETGKRGFIDQSGKEVVPLIYDGIYRFSEGLAGVMSNGKWGFVDRNGNVTVSTKYDDLESFSKGFAVVSLNEKFGIIDRNGKEITPFKYDNIDSFKEGFASVRIGDAYTGKHGFIDTTGKEVLPLKYNYAGGFSEGLAVVNKINKWGYIDHSGKEVIPLKYDYAFSFSESLATVLIKNGKMSKWGYIDRTGKEIIPFIYDHVRSFQNGKAEVRINDYRFDINIRGECVSGCGNAPENHPIDLKKLWHNQKHNYLYRNIAKIKLNEKWALVDTTGKAITPFKYDDFGYSFSEGLIKVKLNDKYGFIDTAGNEIIPLIYDTVYFFKNDMVVVKLNDKWGIINKTGEYIITPKYDFADNFSEGLAAVKKGNKWGVIDQIGKEIVSFKYAWIGPFINGVAPVLTGDSCIALGVEDFANPFSFLSPDEEYCKYGFIDTKGNEIIPAKYYVNTSGWFNDAYDMYAYDWREQEGDFTDYFNYGVIPIMQINTDNHDFTYKCSLFDKTGKQITPFMFAGISLFKNGLSIVKSLDDKLGVIDTTGKYIINPMFESLSNFEYGITTAELRVQYKSKKKGVTDTEKLEELYVSKLGKWYADIKEYCVPSDEIIPLIPVADYFSGKVGYTDTTGKEIIPCIYDYADCFKDGLAKVELNNKTFYINTKGECIEDCKNAPKKHLKVEKN